MTVKKKIAIFQNDKDILNTINDYLNKQMDENLVLVGVNNLYFNFEESNKKYSYALEEKRFSSDEDEEEFINMYEDYGYNYIGNENSIYYFKKLGEEINTQRTRYNHLGYKKDLRFLQKIFGWVLITNALIGFSRYLPNENIEFIVFVLASISQITVLLYYIHYLKKNINKKAA